METQYGTVDSADVLPQKVYGMSQEKNKKVQAFSALLEAVINQIIIRLPNKAMEEEMERYLRNCLFYGRHNALQDSIHYLYNDKQITYTQLLVAARKAGAEVLEGKGITTIAKDKASNPQFNSSSSEVNEFYQQVANLMSIVESTQTNSTKGQNGKDQSQGKGPQMKRDQGTNGQHPSAGPTATSAGPLKLRVSRNHINAIIVEVGDIS